MHYVKLFSEIVASSVWEEADSTRILWITMLVLKGRSNFVRGTVPFLARTARITPEQCEAGLKKLSEPDPLSRSREFEGRRIKAEAGGWTILNGAKYGNMLSYEQRKEYNRIKQQEYRRRKKETGVGYDGEAFEPAGESNGLPVRA